MPDVVRHKDFPFLWKTVREAVAEEVRSGKYRPQAGSVFEVPKGSLVVPSVWSANQQGFTDGETFDPDRFSKERQEDKKFERYFLTFGAGPHYCMGQRYAMNHISCFLSIMAQEIDMKRTTTPNMNRIQYAPTIYPDDGCILASMRYRS